MEVVKDAKLTHRQRQALQTQRLIVEAASELFLGEGYAATTIEAVAARAGVAVSTVYNIFANKRGLLRAIREAWHQESGQRELYRRASEEPDSRRRLELAAHATRRQWETSAAMVKVYESAAAVDAEAAAELRAARSGRRTNLSHIVQAWAPHFKPNLSPERAAALFLGLTQAEVYLELVREWRWTPDEYEAWLADTLKAQLLP